MDHIMFKPLEKLPPDGGNCYEEDNGEGHHHSQECDANQDYSASFLSIEKYTAVERTRTLINIIFINVRLFSLNKFLFFISQLRTNSRNFLLIKPIIEQHLIKI